jgi:hypothetical protein
MNKEKVFLICLYPFRKRRKQREATRKKVPRKPLLFIDFRSKEKVSSLFQGFSSMQLMSLNYEEIVAKRFRHPSVLKGEEGLLAEKLFPTPIAFFGKQ